MKKRHLAMLTTAFLALSAGLAGAATITYEATDLADQTAGEDLWEYAYTVSDHTFGESTGFSIDFPHSLYGPLETNPTAPNSDWDVITMEGFPSIPGVYDALAMKDQPSLADAFIVSFIWKGVDGPPGSQAFQIYQLASNGSLTILENGQTAAVPLPATLLLLGTGMASLLGIRRKLTVS